MKKVLFAFLFVGTFAFSASATNAVFKSETTIDMKLCIKDLKVKKTINSEVRIQKIIDAYCSYTSYANGTQSYSGLVCSPDANSWYKIVDQLVTALDQLDQLARIAAGH